MKERGANMTLLRVRRAWRVIVLVGGTLLLWYWGWDYRDELPMINGLLVPIGAIAVGIGLSKVWPEPKP